MSRPLGYTPDQRKVEGEDPDFVLDPEKHLKVSVVPNHASTEQYVVDVLDQKQLGSCVANAGMQAIRMAHVRQGVKNTFLGSRLFGYYFARAYDHMTGQDAGTQIRFFYQALNKFGFCKETLWPYDDDTSPGAPVFQLPKTVAISNAFDQRAPTVYRRIVGTGEDRLRQIKQAIVAGRPVEFGTMVTRAYTESDLGPQGFVDRPQITDELEGGHAQLITSYEVLPMSGKTIFKILNSWGDGFGVFGYARYSSDYLTWNQTNDLWVVDHTPNFDS